MLFGPLHKIVSISFTTVTSLYLTSFSFHAGVDMEDFSLLSLVMVVMVVMVSRGPPVPRLGFRLRMGKGSAELLVVRVFRFWLSFGKVVGFNNFGSDLPSVKFRSYRGKNLCYM